jgi:hypothetical protein
MTKKMTKKNQLDQPIFEERKDDPLFFLSETDKIIMEVTISPAGAIPVENPYR